MYYLPLQLHDVSYGLMLVAGLEGVAPLNTMATSPDDVAVPPRFSLNANTMTEPPTRQLDFYQAMSDFRQVRVCRILLHMLYFFYLFRRIFLFQNLIIL